MKKTGWSMTALFAFFMLAGSAAPKLLYAQVARESMTAIGWPTQHLFLIGVIEAAAREAFEYGLHRILVAEVQAGADHLRQADA